MAKPATIATRRPRRPTAAGEAIVTGSLFNLEEKSSCRFSADAGREIELCNSWLRETQVVALAMRRLFDADTRRLFGAHPGSVRVREGVDLVAPALDVAPDAETGREIER
jgi:hypothetical protein